MCPDSSSSSDSLLGMAGSGWHRPRDDTPPKPRDAPATSQRDNPFKAQASDSSPNGGKEPRLQSGGQSIGSSKNTSLNSGNGNTYNYYTQHGNSTQGR